MSLLRRGLEVIKSAADPVPVKTLPSGRRTVMTSGYGGSLSPYRSRTSDTLKTLRGIGEETRAIEFLRRVNPDVSMAVWNFVRLANQGNETHIYGLDGETRRKDLEEKWREFASEVNEISNSGLDGLIDQMHYSFYVLGGIGMEVEVNQERTAINDIHLVKPQTVEWETQEVKGREVWVPFQYGKTGQKVYLDAQNANFFWVPADPDIGDPRGSLTLAPVLQAIDFQMQILQDIQAVLHHQGYPKNDVVIDMEQLMKNCPASIKADSKKLEEYIDNIIATTATMMETMNPDSDYIHTSDIKINRADGNAATRSLDIRALLEGIDPGVLSGLKQMSIFMNRNTGVTESWGTVQFKIYASGIASCQRNSKRAVERAAQLWLRVNGEQGIVKFEHNTLDWNSEEQRQKVALMKQEYYAVAQMMGWISSDQAAQEMMGVQRAFGEPNENIRVAFSTGGGKANASDTDEHNRARGGSKEKHAGSMEKEH